MTSEETRLFGITSEEVRGQLEDLVFGRLGFVPHRWDLEALGCEFDGCCVIRRD